MTQKFKKSLNVLRFPILYEKFKLQIDKFEKTENIFNNFKEGQHYSKYEDISLITDQVKLLI